MSTIMEVQTDDNLEYKFYPVSTGSVQFKVRTPNDAHIALTMGPQEADPMVEIFIGGWGNTKSVIRRNRTKPEKVEIETPQILNGGEYRGFWVRWDGGVISAGREGEQIPFISWIDPEPFPIAFVGVCTGWGATGTWKIEDRGKFETNSKYNFGPVSEGELRFDFRGPHNCHVCLTPGPVEKDPIYEIIIGGWENTHSIIRYCKQSPAKASVATPDILDPNNYKSFAIHWKGGRISVTDTITGTLIMEWVDPEPFNVTHFGIRTAHGATGDWLIQHFNYTDKKSH